MMIDNLEASFNPEHLTDLGKSGLLNETILEANMKSVCPRDINKIFGYETYAKSAYEIPYSGTDYSRYKMFYDEANKINPKTGKKRPKYLARKNSGNCLYIPLRVIPILKNSDVPLHVTEGEKKALKACQEGLYCIGLSGLWNWSNGNKELIPDFDLINFTGRPVYIVPDSDWLELDKQGYEKNLKQAVCGLSKKLQERGAIVKIVQLPKE